MMTILLLLTFLVLASLPPVPSASAQTVVATVKVGSNPRLLAYDSIKGEIFVSDQGSSSVSVISDSTDLVLATVTVGSNPAGVVYDSGKGEVFVANF